MILLFGDFQITKLKILVGIRLVASSLVHIVELSLLTSITKNAINRNCRTPRSIQAKLKRIFAYPIKLVNVGALKSA